MSQIPGKSCRMSVKQQNRQWHWPEFQKTHLPDCVAENTMLGFARNSESCPAINKKL